ncbi:hypothetical protein H5410_064854 [Solanum commersonii]|uniref:Uncharacterized protein n=1 Tax=Solanum commersonii TaxID=4109 RepID=A0A9J5VY76_SOLCO|nr:hypothetical protein H5410_064854 [Solanum commersonii]
MDLMKQNHEKLQSELLQMRQFIQKYAPNESFPQDINDTSNEQFTRSLGYLLKRGFSTRYSLVLFASPLPAFFLCPAHPLLVVQCADPVTLGQ